MIAVARTVIDSVFVGKRLTHDAAKKACEPRGSKPRRSNRPKSYKIVCAGCGKE